jgi:hypothetical protein
MMVQPVLMVLVLCWASGLDWAVKGNVPAALAFFAFGAGYGALGMLFAGGPA